MVLSCRCYVVLVLHPREFKLVKWAGNATKSIAGPLSDVCIACYSDSEVVEDIEDDLKECK